MRFFLFSAVLSFFLFLSCKPPQKKKTEPVLQGVKGSVMTVEGNQMPRIGAPVAEPKPYPTTVFFYEPTDLTKVLQWNKGPLFINIYTKLVMAVDTDSTGTYVAKLPVGTYSVFVQTGQQFFANQFDIRNNINLVTVEKGKLTELNILVNFAASY